MNLSDIIRTDLFWIGIVLSMVGLLGYTVGVSLEARRWEKLIAAEHGRMMKKGEK